MWSLKGGIYIISSENMLRRYLWFLLQVNYSLFYRNFFGAMDYYLVKKRAPVFGQCAKESIFYGRCPLSINLQFWEKNLYCCFRKCVIEDVILMSSWLFSFKLLFQNCGRDIICIFAHTFPKSRTENKINKIISDEYSTVDKLQMIWQMDRLMANV